MEIGLGIFAKTASLSLVKTRLAATIGEAKAHEFYVLSLKAIEQMAQSLPASIHPHWAIAEEEGLSAEQWQNLSAFWTGEGDLGQRLHQVYLRLQQQYGAAMLIGTDSPQLTPTLLVEAQKRLAESPQSIVISPCDDGGFTLFAAATEIPATIWQSVEYSQSTTLQQLANALESKGKSISYLPSQQDVDVAADLEKLQRHLAEQDGIPSAQQALLAWLKKL